MYAEGGGGGGKRRGARGSDEAEAHENARILQGVRSGDEENKRRNSTTTPKASFNSPSDPTRDLRAWHGLLHHLLVLLGALRCPPLLGSNKNLYPPPLRGTKYFFGNKPSPRKIKEGRKKEIIIKKVKKSPPSLPRINSESALSSMTEKRK